MNGWQKVGTFLSKSFWGGQTGGQTKTPLNDKQKLILKVIKLKPNISRSELALKLKINPSAVQKHLDKLKQEGLMERVGTYGGYWKMI